MEPQLAEKQEAIEKVKREITAEKLQLVFNFLDTANAEAPAYIMESLVGLMRRMRKADTKSVELYTKNYSGFQIGLSRLKLEDLNYDHCAYHSENIKKWTSKIHQREFTFIIPFYNLLEEITMHAAFASQIVKYKKERTELQELILSNIREMEFIDMVLKSASIEKVLIDDMINYRQNHLKYFSECRDHINKVYNSSTSRDAFF